MSNIAGEVKRLIGRYRFIIGGLMIIAALLLGMLAYSGMWPPVYVVESASMQHSDSESYLGIIDTGDLVLVQSSDGGGVRTYVECYPDGHRAFGDYGDVIVYERYGSSEFTPIIHRAMLRLVYNTTSDSFDIPSLADLPADKWSNGGLEEGRWWDLTNVVVLYDVGYRSAVLSVNLSPLLVYEHGGIITMGDHNVMVSNGVAVGIYDQSTTTICREPILDEWIVGEAKIELPWLGLIKLWVNGDLPSNTPDNSKTSLMFLIALVVVVPLAADFTDYVLKKRGIDLWARLKARLRRKE